MSVARDISVKCGGGMFAFNTAAYTREIHDIQFLKLSLKIQWNKLMS